LIRHHLLDNPHRVTVVLAPDAELARRQSEAEAERLAAARAAMSAEEAAAVMAQAAELKRQQETPDPPEVVALLPSLRRADLEPRHKPIPLAEHELAGARVLSHDLFTNGIVYLDLALDVQPLPAELLPYVPLFGRALTQMGTAAEDFVRLSQRIGQTTGGLYATTLVAPVRREAEQGSKGAGEQGREARTGDASSSPAQWASSATAAHLLLRGKATAARAPELLAILRDVLLTVRLDNRDRFRQILLESKARLEAQLAPAGHVLANTRLRAHFHPALRVEETFGGLSQLLFLRQLAEQVEADWPGVLARLEAVRAALITRAGALANVTLDAAGYAAFAPRLEELLAALPLGDDGRQTMDDSQSGDRGPSSVVRGLSFPAHEGFAFPSAVNYVAKGANLYDLGYAYHGSIAVINNLLRNDYLLPKVRIQGGAYGAFATFSPNAGVLTFLSYRDPNLANTLRAYDGAAGFLRGLALDEAALAPAIVGAIGSIDAYQLPDAKGYTSLVRYLTNETDAYLQTVRDQVLATTAADFHRLADVVAQVAAVGDVVVLGSAEALAGAAAEGVGLAVVEVM
ncbi:MAG TPA: peptidase M16, partial [Promineifilum sp.]|nr:peptidase M16 [Promineifilum sp.]